MSVLLSDYSHVFFQRFEHELLKEAKKVVSDEESSKLVRTSSASCKYQDELLHKILFLLRIACKAMDEEFLRILGFKKASAISLKTVFTVPKGSGWESAIAFINKHKAKLQFRYMGAILPVLNDWNLKHKRGETTKNASQIALFYFDELTKHEDFYFGDRDDTKDKLIRTILNGSGEIKPELTRIVNQILAAKDTSHRGRYYELVKVILSSIADSSEISKHLPVEVIRLANLFWSHTPKKNRYPFSGYRNDIEQYFDLAEGHFRYYPASAFQTPILQLLQTDPQATVAFILSLTNKSIEYFAKTDLGQREAEEINVLVDVEYCPSAVVHNKDEKRNDNNQSNQRISSLISARYGDGAHRQFTRLFGILHMRFQYREHTRDWQTGTGSLTRSLGARSVRFHAMAPG